jgi:tripartite-type tricarboxylate transporter receptor subunit TctC
MTNNLTRRSLLTAMAGFLTLLASRLPADADSPTYPVRPVRVIVPFAPGGATDIIARLVLQELSKRLRRQFFVENIPGASGTIGTGQAARATPDGYTILFAFSSHVTNPSMFEKLSYNPVADFTPITLIVNSPAVMSVNPSLPVNTVQDLLALIRAHPKKYSFASGGTGTQPHLAGEQLRLSLGLDLAHVPYNGGGPALASTVAGHTPICLTTLAPAVAFLKEGKLRALAVTGRKRSQIVSDVPTMTEIGYPNIEGDTWVGLLAPAGTPDHVLTLLHREIVDILGLSEMKQRLIQLGYEPVGNAPDAYAAQIHAEITNWSKVIRSAGIRAQRTD